MFDTLSNISSYKEFSVAARALLGSGAFEELEDEMVSSGVMFNHADRWGRDRITRALRKPAATDATLSELKGEKPEQRVLHVLQLMQVGMPVLANDIEHFLARVTYK